MELVTILPRSKGHGTRVKRVGDNRNQFWLYCIATEAGSRVRAAKAKVPHAIDRYFIDRLLVDQKWCCAVSGIRLNVPRSSLKFNRDPFGPSLDRITPTLGYVPGNVRIVCTMVNSAMGEWGLTNLRRLVFAMAPQIVLWDDEDFA
jgi:hypothetical protein